MLFEVLFYDAWSDPPAYLLVEAVEGETAEEALKENLPEIITAVREVLDMNEEELPDEAICEMLYLVPADALIPARKLTASGR